MAEYDNKVALGSSITQLVTLIKNALTGKQNTLTAEQQAAVDAMRTDTLPPTDNRTNIDYDAPGDYSELAGYRIN